MLSTDNLEKTTVAQQITDPASKPGQITFINTLQDADTDFLLWMNQLSGWQPVELFFRIISRLGDGMFWYSLIGVMIYQAEYQVALHLTVVAIAGLVIYKILKSHTERPRPYIENSHVVLRGKPLDEFSFPSGHTLHAFSLTIVALFYFPMLGLFLVPFTLLIAASRSVLGLHYPSDVAAGASIGILIAGLSLVIFGLL